MTVSGAEVSRALETISAVLTLSPEKVQNIFTSHSGEEA